MIKDKQVQSLIEKYKTIYSLEYMLLLSNWDIETYMPKNGIATRGIVSGKIESLIQKLSLDKTFVFELKALHDGQTNLNDEEKAIIRSLWHSYDRCIKLPAEFVESFANLISTSSTVWAKAKENNDYDMFKPFLKKIGI